VFEQQQRVDFRDIMAGDKSCFLQHYNDRQIWSLSADELPTRVAYTKATTKIMLTVFLSIHSVIFMIGSRHGKFNSGYFVKK
jgi:hypothetical protein